jgi:hypothetical protein
LAQHLDDLWESVTRRFHKALQTHNLAYRAICHAHEEDRFGAFETGLQRWRAELIALQESIINELEAMWVTYGISMDDREWVPEGLRVMWKPLQNSTLRWIVEALNVWPEATSWVAPDWLYHGNLQAIKILSVDEWASTQNLLRILCHAVETKLSLEREQALNDARRARRLSSPAAAPIDGNLARSRQGQEKRKFAKDFEGLKHKQVDLSQYMDVANLSERQYACYSLAKEYALPLVEIAGRLNLSHHSTVAEHIARAETKIRNAHEAAKMRAK